MAPFWTVTEYVPALGRTVAPSNCVEEPVRLGTLHGVHPGPEKLAMAVEGSKPEPVRAKVNGEALDGGEGEVEIAVN